MLKGLYEIQIDSHKGYYFSQEMNKLVYTQAAPKIFEKTERTDIGL